MRVLISGWIGSTNLGDELVLAGVRALLGSEATVAAISTSPSMTAADHQIVAIDHRRVDRIARAARTADLVVFGGGGIVQDQTSPWNLPYHLSRPLFAALAGTPWIGLDLGVGPLEGRVARRLATSLQQAAAVTVRDEPSQALLAELGVDARLAADAAFHLPAPQVEVEPSAAPADDAPIVVSLRPWGGTSTGASRWLPVGWRATQEESDWFVPTVAGALDRAADRTGRPVRFVALQTDRDAELHERVAATMRTPTTAVVPSRHTLLTEFAGAAVAVAMRYHAGISATLIGRPSVLIGYSPKVDALAGALGDGAILRGFSQDDIGRLDEAIESQLASTTAAASVVAARQQLRDRARIDAAVIEQVTANGTR